MAKMKRRHKPVNRLKLLAQLEMRATTLKGELDVTIENLKKKDQVIENLQQRIRDNDDRYGRQQAVVERQREEINQLKAERDRVVRLVDQFTSVCISPVDKAGANSPYELRRLHKV